MRAYSLAALGDDGTDGRSARGRLADETLAAPELIDLEVTSVWRARLPPGSCPLGEPPMRLKISKPAPASVVAQAAVRPHLAIAAGHHSPRCRVYRTG